MAFGVPSSVEINLVEENFYLTEHAMISTVDNIKKQVSEGKVCVLVRIDLRNAFPSVHREKFLSKMVNIFKISDFWLRDYFTQRMQYVELNNKKSHEIENVTGLIQGSVLGPMFFTYYINDIEQALKFSKVEIFVDDTNLVFVGEYTEKQKLTQNINVDMKSIVDWMEDNVLMLNGEKTKVIVFGTKLKIERIGGFIISVGNSLIEDSAEIKWLGLVIQKNLKWNLHIQNMIKKCYWTINNIYKIREYFQSEALKIIMEATVNSVIEYMIVIWGDTTKKNLKKSRKGY